MTADEEFTLLEESIRQLKIEFDIYFNGGSPRPPTDRQWRVESIIKKYGDAGKLSFAQRFRYNSIVQKYAVYNDMWRQRVKNKEEGRDPRQRREAVATAAAGPPPAYKVQWNDPDKETDKVEQLFQKLVEAKKQCGEAADSLPIDSFKRFVKQKTEQLKKDFGCKSVEYVVEVENGQVRLKAKGGS